MATSNRKGLSRDEAKAIAHERISNAVEELMMERAISRRELASALGLPPSSLSRALSETRPREWKGYEILALAAFFDVPEQLFFDEDRQMFRAVWGERLRPDALTR